MDKSVICEALYALPGNIVEKRRKGIAIPLAAALVGAAVLAAVAVMAGKSVSSDLVSVLAVFGAAMVIGGIAVTLVRIIGKGGDPYLRASQIHDVALNIGYRFLQFSVSYNQTKDWIRMTDELRQGDPLTIVLFHTNEPTFRKVSARLTFQHKIGLWNPIWTAGIRRDFWKLYDFKGERIHLDNPYGYFSLNNTFSLWKGILLNLDCFYATAGSIGESQKRPEAYIDIGLRKSFLKDALSVNLQYWDMFKSLDTQSIIYTEHIDYNRWNYSDSRCIRLTLTWYFNKYDNRYKGKNSAGSDIYRM